MSTPDKELDIAVTPEQLRRYDRPGPRYTSYPTAVEFHDGVGEAEYLEKLEAAEEVEVPGVELDDDASLD